MKQAHFNDNDMKSKNQNNVTNKIDDEYSIDIHNGKLSAMYKYCKNSKSLFVTSSSYPVPITTDSFDFNKSKADLMTLEKQDRKANKSRKILTEQEIGPALIEDVTGKIHVNETDQPRYMFLNMLDGNTSSINNLNRNNDSTLDVYDHVSPVFMLLSTLFSVPLQMVGNENMDTTSFSSENGSNTREKVSPKINVLSVEDNVITQAILGSFFRKQKISYKFTKHGLPRTVRKQLIFGKKEICI